jgi:hypothetical protein
VGLRELAEQDLAVIVEDRDGGFGWDIVVTDPAGVNYTLVGLSTDIAQAVDPETGQLVTGRSAAVSIRISSLLLAGATSLPRAIPDKGGKPWLVSFDDINGAPWTFKVQHASPDRALGVLTLQLELYGA